MQLSEQLIYCTTKIISIIDEDKIATGTGFFMNFNENSNITIFKHPICTS